jgi:hypothetical protein
MGVPGAEPQLVETLFVTASGYCQDPRSCSLGEVAFQTPILAIADGKTRTIAGSSPYLNGTSFQI